jgi:hypothetical protein
LGRVVNPRYDCGHIEHYHGCFGGSGGSYGQHGAGWGGSYASGGGFHNGPWLLEKAPAEGKAEQGEAAGDEFFQETDKNGDGEVQPSEVAALISRLGDHSEEQAAQMFKDPCHLASHPVRCFARCIRRCHSCRSDCLPSLRGWGTGPLLPRSWDGEWAVMWLAECV